MITHYTSFEDLKNAALQYLRDIGLAKATIKIYRLTWTRLGKYIAENNVNNYNDEIALKYIESIFGHSKVNLMTQYQKDQLRHVVSLSYYIKSGKIPVYIDRRLKYKLNCIFENYINEYLEHKKTMRISEKTLKAHKWYLHLFTEYLVGKGIVALHTISPSIILLYATDSFPQKHSTKNYSLIVIRMFLQYLYDNKHIQRDLSLIVPKHCYRHQATVPSIYSKTEVITILDSIDRSTSMGKRDYAIIILAVRLGLRASDIAALEFNYLNWTANKISFSQMKTGHPIVLPLLVDVGDSIINYIKNARPISDNNKIFLSPRYPHSPLASEAISHMVQKVLVNSGVKIDGRKHGPHALRHTMASFMINGEISLPIISEVLGHTNIQSSMNYLRIDVETMRQCALEVPLVPESFYEQKGDLFDE